MADDLGEKYELIADCLLSGEVVPVLGAGANLCDRPPDVGFQQGGRYLPSGEELAVVLAKFGRYPMGDVPMADVLKILDLARVSQYAAVQRGEDSLCDKLHDLFASDYPPTRLHYFLARLARHTRVVKEARECMLLVTTNYDDALEQAFRGEKEPYDLVTYINNVEEDHEEDRGLFRHILFDGEFDGMPSVIRAPNECTDLLKQRTVIAKIHGAVDRSNGEDSFVITEDDYVDYVTRADIEHLFPIALAKKIKKSHFLFLGYGLRDWNFRVMLYRLWRGRARRKSWAIEAKPDPVDRATWDVRGVDILSVRVETFVDEIEQRLPALVVPR